MSQGRNQNNHRLGGRYDDVDVCICNSSRGMGVEGLPGSNRGGVHGEIILMLARGLCLVGSRPEEEQEMAKPQGRFFLSGVLSLEFQEVISRNVCGPFSSIRK
jgi:hypothetical protein